MHVDALSDSHCPLLWNWATLSRSPIEVILMLSRSPGTTTTRAPTASTSAASSVASVACAWARGVVNDDHVGVRAVGETRAHRRRSGRAAGDDHVGTFAVARVPGGHYEDHERGDGPRVADAARTHRFILENGELLQATESNSLAGGHDD